MSKPWKQSFANANYSMMRNGHKGGEKKKRKNIWYAYTVSILFTNMWTSFTTTDNSKLYNRSALGTVAQNTILIYSNTFFPLQCTSLTCPHNKNAKHKPKRPQKCMLSGQLEATGSKHWHESGNEISQYHKGDSPYSKPVSCRINS